MELKRGSYSRLKLDCGKIMTTQWRWLQLKIRALSYKIFLVNHIWFWSLGSQKSKASNELQFKVEMREIWLIEVRLCKGHAIMGLSSGQIIFSCLGSIFGLFLWKLGPLGFSFFINPIFGCMAILVIWILSKF